MKWLHEILGKSMKPTLPRRPMSVRPQVEVLEDRRLMSVVAPPSPGTAHIMAASRAASTSGLMPDQIRTAYGINAINFGKTAADGSGQTIAIIDVFNDPNIFHDLDVFDQQFATAPGKPTLYGQYGPASSFLTVYDENGNIINPSNTSVPVDPTGAWEGEEALDVEWAHAIAPGAKIALIECSHNSVSNLFATAPATAARLPGVSVVSMSYMYSLNGKEGEFSSEPAFDRYFTTPQGHQGVTFLASAGDHGGTGYAATSVNVVAVGGTSLYLNADNTIQNETAWNLRSDGWGTGGGFSQYEKTPSYQLGVNNTGFRSTPDIAFVGDPGTGVWVYNSYRSAGWNRYGGGTSLSAPCWGGLIAIANQGRTLLHQPTLNSSTNPTQTLNALYALPGSDFHDITSGSNGTFSARAGYDEVTGRGTPIANLVVGDLVAYGAATQLVVTGQPPSSVTAGASFAVTVKAENALGNVDYAFSGAVRIGLANHPGGSTLGGFLSVTASHGVASFANLTLDQAGSGYSLVLMSDGLANVKTNSITVNATRVSSVLDVSLTSTNTSVGVADGYYGQTFVPSISGALTQLNVLSITSTFGARTVTVEIYEGGVNASTLSPAGKLIASQTFSFQTGTNTFVFATPPQLVAGHTYLWRVRSGSQINADWSTNATSPHGAMLGAPTCNWVSLCFQTFMQPAALAGMSVPMSAPSNVKGKPGTL